MKSSKTILLEGVVVEGLGESSSFTCLSWVKEQLISRLGIDPYPGTFNLEIKDTANLELYRRVKLTYGLNIKSAESGFCPARGYPVLVGGKIKGALIVPLVPHYPEGKLEIVAAISIREALGLINGDVVKIEVFI
jgi:CTP-dependent riboflavin kinase